MARGETGKARSTLAELREQIAVVIPELQRVSEDRDKAKTELGKLVNDIHSRRSELATLDRMMDIYRTAVEGLTFIKSRLIRSNAEITDRTLSMDKAIEQKKEVLTETSVGIQIAKIEKERHLTESEKEHKKKNLLAQDISRLESERIVIGARVEAAHQEERLSMERKQRIDSAIEEALTGFRIFENRIMAFSRETGYMVGYTDPAKVIEHV